MERTTRLVTTAAAVLMMAAAPASAGEIVGSDLSGVVDVPNFSTGITAAGTGQRTGATLPMAATAAGVIVEIKIKHSDVPHDATGAFSILSGDGQPNFDARTSTLLPTVVWQNGQGAAVRTFRPLPDANGHARGVPVVAGERMAYRSLTGDFSPGITDNTSPGAQYRYFLGSHVMDAQFYVSEIANRELMVQMRIEPDADRDGYGDETQDPCPITTGLACAAPCEQATKVGTSGDDVIVGTAGNDVIAAGAGADKVFGLGGDDIICGADGNDVLKGGSGNDFLLGETGADNLKGGGGTRDFCTGGQGFDRATKCERIRSL